MSEPPSTLRLIEAQPVTSRARVCVCVFPAGGGSPACAQLLLQPQRLLEPQVLHLLAAAPAVLPAAVLHMGAAGGCHPEPGHPAGTLQRRLQLHRAGQLVAAAVEGAARVREAQLEGETGGRGQDHGAAGGAGGAGSV